MISNGVCSFFYTLAEPLPANPAGQVLRRLTYYHTKIDCIQFYELKLNLYIHKQLTPFDNHAIKNL